MRQQVIVKENSLFRRGVLEHETCAMLSMMKIDNKQINTFTFYYK